jgi:FMN-dependent NADH-azoreductase
MIVSKILYIKANSKPEDESRTFRISERFIGEYKKHHPQDEVITLDLYNEDIGFLSEEGIRLKSNPGEGKNPLLRYAHQFVEADKIIFAEPLWNLSIPAILKAYIDYICIVGMTFKYTAEGPVGLCKDKKVLNITTRGGEYSTGPFASWEMGDKYLRTVMGFLGITDFTTISANSLDVIGTNVDAIVNKAIKEAEELAKTF